jgi:hypothetical protein
MGTTGLYSFYSPTTTISDPRTAPDKTAIERQIAATDKQIDQLVDEPHRIDGSGNQDRRRRTEVISEGKRKHG